MSSAGSFRASKPSVPRLAEPSMTPSADISFHVVINSSLRVWRPTVANLPNEMTRRPTLQAASDLFAHRNRPFLECLPATRDLCWEPLLAPRFIHPRAGRFLWRSNLKARHVDTSAGSPRQDKTFILFFNKMSAWKHCAMDVLRKSGFSE